MAAADDYLAGSVDVGRVSAGLTADLFNRNFVDADEGRHPAGPFVASALHVSASLGHEADHVGDGEDLCDGQGRVFAEAVTGSHVGDPRAS